MKADILFSSPLIINSKSKISIIIEIIIILSQTKSALFSY